MRTQCPSGHYFDPDHGPCQADDGGEPCGYVPPAPPKPKPRRERSRLPVYEPVPLSAEQKARNRWGMADTKAALNAAREKARRAL